MSRTHKNDSETCETCDGEGFVKSPDYRRGCFHFGNDPACSCWETCEDCDGAGVIHDWRSDPDLSPNERICETCGAWSRIGG